MKQVNTLYFVHLYAHHLHHMIHGNDADKEIVILNFSGNEYRKNALHNYLKCYWDSV